MTRHDTFAGRETEGHKVLLMGFVELCLDTRKCTGRTVLIEIADNRRVTLEPEIRKRCHPGAKTWTDGLKSFEWMRRTTIFKNDYVVHSDGEFSEMTVGV